MPRRRSTKRRVVRRIARRLARKFRSRRMSMGRKKYRIKKPKSIGGRLRFKGVKTRLNLKKELKILPYAYVQQDLTVLTIDVNRFVEAYPTIIWSNNGSDGSGRVAPADQYFPNITQGTEPYQAIGQKYNLKYVEVSFEVAQTFFDTNDPETTDPDRQDNQFRLMILKQRDPNIDITHNNIFWLHSQGVLMPNSPIDTRKWDVQYDRTFNKRTGLQQNVQFGDGDPPVNIIYTGVDGNRSNPNFFRFIIPLKHTFNIANGASKFPLRLSILINARREGFYVNNINAIYRFTDP